MERQMKKIHPGQILHMELVEGRNLTISKIAELLGTTRANFSNIINGHASISPNMALRLEKVFGGSASHFLNLQRSYDLAKAKADFLINTPNLKRYEIA
ncbi:MAG TPA: addiction module antidote protein, HigA family [Flavobacterium sp.]|nr:addiction module antidote protein, HigA family [Flavobacterium sp.]HAT76262.1 addiction module antidote protein, HigA family [Flavobacterium sp.]